MSKHNTESKVYLGLMINHKKIKAMLRISKIGYPNPKNEKNQVIEGLTKGERYANKVSNTRTMLM